MGSPAEAYPLEESDPTAVAPSTPKFVWVAVMVAALGYFVDVFDMWLFANFRVPSLTAVGVSGAALTEAGAFIQNWQQVGFLVGGVTWGVMGDKRGRVSVMFGSIFIYSAATLLTAFATTVDQFAVLRCITGFGLAGEIGAGITLISEILPKERRGYGTTLVATIGVAGALAAALVGKFMYWQHAYILGAVMGFALLALRIAVHESGMYASMKKEENVSRGSLFLLFSSGSRVLRLLCCLLIGVPIYLTFGLLIFFAPEIAASLGIQEKISVPDVMLWGSIGITVGDLASGLISQGMRSRTRPILFFLLIGFLVALLSTGGYITTAHGYQYAMGVLGTAVGYWACLLTATAEQFGTNLRATVTTVVANIVRGSAIILNASFLALKSTHSASQAAFMIAIPVFLLALVGLACLKDTFGKDLNYLER